MEQHGKAFVAMSFDKRFALTYEKGICPAIDGSGLVPIRVDKEAFVGNINDRIMHDIKEAKLCIADISGSNPNVFYEVALAHSCNKPVIFISRDNLNGLPFDTRQYKTITYRPTPEGYLALKDNLIKALESIGYSKETRTSLLRKLLVPQSIDTVNIPFVISACPLSFKAAYRRRDVGWNHRIITYSDQVGIRGLIQAFGTIYAFDKWPELLDPDNYRIEMLEKNMHLYSIASPKANQWTGEMLKRFFKKRSPKFEFRLDPESKYFWNPKVVMHLDGKEWHPAQKDPKSKLDWDFGMVLRGPYPGKPKNLMMIMAGRGAVGTEAACHAATNPECINRLVDELDNKGINLEDHRQSFCAIVSAKSYKDKDRMGIADIGSLQIEGVTKL